MLIILMFSMGSQKLNSWCPYIVLMGKEWAIVDRILIKAKKTRAQFPAQLHTSCVTLNGSLYLLSTSVSFCKSGAVFP